MKNPEIVLITGAAGALGRAVAQAFAADGATLVLVDINADVLAKAYGREHRQVAVDLGDRAAAMKALAAQGATVLCNIAGGFTMGTPVHDTPEAAWRSMADLNLGTLINSCSAVVPGMLKAGRGKIVNVAAAAATSGKAQMGAYVAAKSGVARLTESMALELREKGINVNAVAPTILDTPANRAAMPDADPRRWVNLGKLASVIRFLASDEADAVHGAVLPVTGLS